MDSYFPHDAYLLVVTAFTRLITHVKTDESGGYKRESTAEIITA